MIANERVITSESFRLCAPSRLALFKKSKVICSVRWRNVDFGRGSGMFALTPPVPFVYPSLSRAPTLGGDISRLNIF